MTRSISKQIEALREDYDMEFCLTSGHVGHIVCGCAPSFRRMRAISNEIHRLLDAHPRLDHRPLHMRPDRGG